MSIVKGKGGTEAKVILASISNDIPIITMQLKYPRFIHSEFMTHRMFSRNASSSRAIPVEKLLEQVRNNPAMPIHWGKNKPGMQADEEVEHQDNKYTWIHVCRMSSRYAEAMSKKELHKQVVNRILEPYQFMHTVVTATEWDNFFKLRTHKDAQPEIQELALCMKEAMAYCEYRKLEPGDWHLPYVTEEEKIELSIENQIKTSVAKCARCSYNKHDSTKASLGENIELFNMLVTRPYTTKHNNSLLINDPIHASPLEHQATPMTHIKDIWSDKGQTHIDKQGNLWSNNFRGWLQYRAIYEQDTSSY